MKNLYLVVAVVVPLVATGGQLSAAAGAADPRAPSHAPVDLFGPVAITKTRVGVEFTRLHFTRPANVAGPFVLVVEGKGLPRGRHSPHTLASIWLNHHRVLGPRRGNGRTPYVESHVRLRQENELLVAHLGRPGNQLTLRVVAEGCGGGGRCQSIRMCHFDSDGPPKIVHVKRASVTRWLERGDVLAPETITDPEACLIPQLPQEPVSAAGVTDANGTDVLVIGNVRVLVRVVDPSGAPLPGMAVQALAIGEELLVTSFDSRETPVFAPSWQEGNLLDAHAASAPKVAVEITMQVAEFIFPGVGQLSSGQSAVPPFVPRNFSVEDACLSEVELRDVLLDQCLAGAAANSVGVSIVTGGEGGLMSFLSYAGDGLQCMDKATKGAGAVFAAAGPPPFLNVRQFKHQFPLPGVPPFPVFVSTRGACGGACCLASACQDFKEEAQCTAAAGHFMQGAFCASNRCAAADLDTGSFPPSGVVEVGDQASCQFYVRNLGPGMAQGVSLGLASSAEITLGSSIFSVAGPGQPCSSASVSQPCSGLTCVVGALAADACVTVETTVTGLRPGQGTASLQTASATQDPNVTNDSAVVTWTVDCPQGQSWDPSQNRCVVGTLTGVVQGTVMRYAYYGTGNPNNGWIPFAGAGVGFEDEEGGWYETVADGGGFYSIELPANRTYLGACGSFYVGAGSATVCDIQAGG